MNRGNEMEYLKAAMGLFGFAFVLSLAAFRYRKPGGKLISPIWKLRDNYERRGVVLNVVALALMVGGFVCYFISRP